MVVAGAGSLPRGFPGEEGTSPPQATNDPLLALCFVARVHQVAAEPVSLRHAMGLAPAEPLGSHHLVMAARHIGLKAKVVRTTLERLPHLSLPALVVLRGGQAAENATLNHVLTCRFIAGSAESIFKKIPVEGHESAVIVDPPRKGCDEAFLEQLHAFAPRRIVYVSCSPGTLARDAGLLVHQGGYHCVAAGAVNMFPHTAHVESMAVFERD